MKILSTAFGDGEPMPSRYTADGDNHSPPLVFDAVPNTARTLALTMEDVDASEGPFVHWVMFNMEPHTGGLAQAEIAGRYRDGVNGFGDLGYTGPHAFEDHRYVFRLYALDERLNLANAVTLTELMQAMQGHIIESAELTTSYRCTGTFPAAPFSRANDIGDKARLPRP